VARSALRGCICKPPAVWRATLSSYTLDNFVNSTVSLDNGKNYFDHFHTLKARKRNRVLTIECPPSGIMPEELDRRRWTEGSFGRAGARAMRRRRGV